MGGAGGWGRRGGVGERGRSVGERGGRGRNGKDMYTRNEMIGGSVRSKGERKGLGRGTQTINTYACYTLLCQ